jgi:putative intracellular protease/amidase
MTNTGTSGGHPDSPPDQRQAMNSHARPAGPRRRRYSRVLSVGGTILLSVMTFAAMLVAGALVTNQGLHQDVPTSQGQGARHAYGDGEPATSNVAVRHGRPLVVAIVAGTSGTVASDLLAPYDVFASSPAFRTYVVAAHTGPVPLEGGPALLPTHTFAHVDADPALTPDLVVVPALSKPTGRTEATLRSWVRSQRADGARVLGVCAGSVVLAETGMLDGLHATSHWSRIGALENSRPAVHWVTGRRWVEDGFVTTTAAVSSGVPAALHLLAELAGAAEAQRVASLHPELGWSPQETTAITKAHFAASDWPVGLNFVEPWFRPTVGIALNDGVDELDATAAFEVYTQSAAARTVALATQDTVRTRHGLVLLPRRPVAVPHRRARRRQSRPAAAALGRQPAPRRRAPQRRCGFDRRSPQWRWLHRGAAEPHRPLRRCHRLLDSQDDRLPDHRPRPAPWQHCREDRPARHRQPHARSPRGAGPRLNRQAPTSPPSGLMAVMHAHRCAWRVRPSSQSTEDNPVRSRYASLPSPRSCWRCVEEYRLASERRRSARSVRRRRPVVVSPRGVRSSSREDAEVVMV